MNKYVKFQFNGAIYRQSGVAMGSLLYPIMANIFMDYLENTELKQTISETMEYSGYVDDTLSATVNTVQFTC